jgi:hypothetical protein
MKKNPKTYPLTCATKTKEDKRLSVEKMVENTSVFIEPLDSNLKFKN